ncbi:putative glycoside hydrolase [Corynebacterium sp.]|uniref:putative glycoside hydrolase n=1 Tax=Corynebacterium sp. TaxID=1720 RepID=UPI0026DD62CF|nr:putative glycoside hydrolase [Corynebacterium sp.]MDO5077061.1 putative glycoside hydrolase [Corynebacterium sp.]
MRPRLGWIRYAGPLSEEEIEQAAGKFRAVILQPWESDNARRLREADPNITVLAYKCLSSVRTYEQGPVYSSGISPAQAEQLQSSVAAPEWAGYPGHVQQKVWDDAYQRAWVDSVTTELVASGFDGVMADNDVYADYYGHGLNMEQVRAGLEAMLAQAGASLRQHGLLLVPNIAESRRQPGRWARHARFGGGYEECWLGWGSANDGWLSVEDCLAQVAEMDREGLIIARVPGTGADDDPYLRLALAAAWVFLPHRDIAVTATSHDGYHCMPLLAEAELDLGVAVGEVSAWRAAGVFSRRFQHGMAVVNLGDHQVTFGYQRRLVTLPARSGRIFHSEQACDVE